MDEKHQDTPGSKPIATEDIRWVLNKRNNLLLMVRSFLKQFERIVRTKCMF